jgi:hypothetical protein
VITVHIPDRNIEGCCIRLRDLGWNTGGSHVLLSVPNATHPRLRFFATLGQEPEIELALV